MPNRYSYVPKDVLRSHAYPILKGFDEDLTALETSGLPQSGNIDASQVATGTINPARLGTGTASASTVLYGDGTWKTPTATTTSVAWTDVTGKPTFATVATSGAYADLSGRPTTWSATALTGVVPTVNLGTGTRDATTVLYGDGTWKAAPTGGGGGVGTDITISQNSNGTWPTITRATGAHYRWFAAYDSNQPPTSANGAQTGDELVTPTGTSVLT